MPSDTSLGTSPIFQGVYSADRTAGLSGVPRTTLHYWARNGIWSPSRATGPPRLWTYGDILGLRIIYWLRHQETGAAPMGEVRRSLETIHRRNQEIWEGALRVLVDPSGKVYFSDAEGMWRGDQSLMAASLDLLSEFRLEPGIVGPDLRRPRPHLRIVPGKLAGEPHVVGTRIGSSRVAALMRDQLSVEQVHLLYPDLDSGEIEECWSLETQLASNLLAA